MANQTIPPQASGAAPLLAAVEAGGTKFLCAVGHSYDQILRQTEIPTTSPEETLGRVNGWFADACAEFGAMTAAGIGSFGPVQLRRSRPDWGHILTTPKPGWSHTDIAGSIGRALQCPVGIDTDVNAAAIAESRLGAGQGTHSLAYITVGTGIGVGLVVGDQPVHGLAHPEAGHIHPRRHPDDSFPGLCPAHGDCLEGLVGGAALLARTDGKLGGMSGDDPLWGFVADYLAQLCANLVLICSPEHIVIGGGVMRQPALLPKIRTRLAVWLNDYAPTPVITAPGLAPASGLIGAFCLAAEAARS